MKGMYQIILALFVLTFISCQSKENHEKFDHVILAINDLEQGMRQFESKTGIKPEPGGIHPNSYTQNAIIALDNESYIEILAPRADIDSVPDWIMEIDRLTPIDWAVATQNIDLTRKKLSDIELVSSQSETGSRATIRGDTLMWTTFGIETERDAYFPFFINWDSQSIHPSINAPSGCTLNNLRIHSNSFDMLTELSQKLNIRLDLISDRKEKMILTINSPKGLVIFE